MWNGIPNANRPQSSVEIERVDADRRGRDRQRQDEQDERRRRGDDQLERPLPALPLDRAARAEQRRRPDPVDRRAERRIEERPRLAARLEHVVRDGRDEQRHEHARQQEEDGERQALDVEPDPDQEEARGPHCSPTSATYASSSVGSRAATRPIVVPSSRPSNVCVSSSPLATGRAAPATARAPRPTRRSRRAPARTRPIASLVDAERLDLDHRPVGDDLLQVARRPLGDDQALVDHGDAVAEARRPRTCSASSAARSCRPGSARRSLRAARGRRPGRPRSSARRGRRPAGRGGGRARCAAAGACRVSSPRPAPSRGR